MVIVIVSASFRRALANRLRRERSAHLNEAKSLAIVWNNVFNHRRAYSPLGYRTPGGVRRNLPRAADACSARGYALSPMNPLTSSIPRCGRSRSQRCACALLTPSSAASA